MSSSLTARYLTRQHRPSRCDLRSSANPKVHSAIHSRVRRAEISPKGLLRHSALAVSAELFRRDRPPLSRHRSYLYRIGIFGIQTCDVGITIIQVTSRAFGIRL